MKKTILRNKKVLSVSMDNEYDEWIVDLKDGYCYEEDGLHTFGGETLKEFRDCMKLVRKCQCKDCLQSTRGTRWKLNQSGKNPRLKRLKDY